MVKFYTRSFNGGIISPDMWGRIDDLKHNTGLAACNNFIVMPQGPLMARPGFRFVREVKDSSKFTRLIPFRFSASQTVMVEAGEAYMRFHTFGGTILTPTTGVSAYNSGSTYDQGDLVTESGSTWYATSSVPTSSTPSSNEYGAAPVVTAAWVLTSPNVTSVPADYTFVGTELPDNVSVGDKVAISRVTYSFVPGSYYYRGRASEFEPDVFGYGTMVESLVFDLYDGAASSATAGYWYELGTVYEIPTPYAETDLAGIKFAQSGDVVTLTHPSYAPMELRRNGATDWTLTEASFGSELSAPTISSTTPTTATSPSDTQTYSYVATTVSDDQLDESVASAASTAVNQLFDTGARNTITFGTAGRRNVYKLSGGLYGYIGQTTTTTLVDDNIAADVSRTPPDNQDPFASDYPRTVAYFEQRKVFAGTLGLPQTFWLSKTGTENNFDYSIPVRDDDAISIKLAALESSTIRHAVPLDELILLTDSAEWRVAPVNSEVLTPTTVSVRPTSYIGASNVQPTVASGTVVYAAARGGHIRGLGFDGNVNSYVSVDLSLRAQHLFDYKQITSLTKGKSPIPIVWATSNDGSLLGMTFVPEQEVYAWHTHTTENGEFEWCSVIDEGDDSIVYAIVKRTIGEATVRYVEAMASQYFADVTDYNGLDSSLSYNGSSTDTFSGLDHLEGQEVFALVDGAVQGPFTVSSGSVTIDEAGEVVVIGLCRKADMQSLPMVAEMEAYAQATRKTISKVTLRVWRSGRFFAGSSASNLYEAKVRTTETFGDPPALQTKEIEVAVGTRWTDTAQIFVRGSDPLPLIISAMTLHVETGG